MVNELVKAPSGVPATVAPTSLPELVDRAGGTGTLRLG